MAQSDIYQYVVDVNGNISYDMNPEYYLYNLNTRQDENASKISQSYIEENKKIDAIINEKYTKSHEDVTPQVSGTGIRLNTVMKPNKGIQAPTLKHFSFGNLKRY